MDKKREAVVTSVVKTSAKKSFRDQSVPILQFLIRHKTLSFFLGWGIVMCFLVSGIAVISMNEKNKPPEKLVLPPIVYPTPEPKTEASAAAEPNLTVTPTASPTPTVDPLAGWKTYTTKTYGYSVKYPSNWTATDLGQLEPKVPNFVTLNPSEATPSSTLAITISSSTRTYSEVAALKSKTRQSVTINTLAGIKTTEKDSDGNESIHVVLSASKYVYILVAKKKYENIFNQLLPSFAPLVQ